MDDEAQAAKDAIDASTTNADVATEQGKGETAINAVNPVADAKPKAKAEVDKVADAKKAAIEADNTLTREEKDVAIKQVDDAAQAAKDAIDAATTNADVATEQGKGETAINAVNPVADAKPKAKAEVDKAADAKKAAIEADNTLTREEKDAAIKQVDDAAQAAKDAIDSATNNADVATEQGKGETAINAVNPVADAKPKAKAEVDKAADAKKAAIEADNTLTREEKDAAIKAVNDAAQAAKDAIDAATTNADVATEQGKGETAINAVNPVADAKPKAKAEVDKAADAKKAAIDADNTLTREEKDAAIKQVDDAAQAAKDAIDAATTNADVATEQGKGEIAIAAINPRADKKTTAKAAIDAALKAKSDAIDARTDLTQEEKDAAKAKLAEDASKAKDAIDAATTNAEVDAASKLGNDSIDGFNPSADKKTTAKAAIDAALKAKSDAIDARTDLTQEEKDAAKAKLAEAASKAKDAIDAATTNAEVDAATKLGLDGMNDFNPSSDTKSDAKAAIDAAAKAKIDALKARTDLNDADKAKAIAEVEELAQKAKDAIDQATSQAQVQALLDQALADIAAVNPAPSYVPCPDCDAKQQGLLPATGETSNQSFFSAAALAVLAGLGLVASGKRKDEEEPLS